jgi:SAM-dependent methyltransferase
MATELKKDRVNNDYYQNNAQSFYNDTVDIDLGPIYRQFTDALPDYGSVLDAGCGSGRDSRYFLNCGYLVSAFDSSKAMAELASKLIELPVEVMTFQQMKFHSNFDGVWACASLLHVSERQLPMVFRNISNCLKDRGVLYCSFKFGYGETENKGRFFTNMNEVLLSTLIKDSGLFIIKTWYTIDSRAERSNEKWINIILKKETK